MQRTTAILPGDEPPRSLPRVLPVLAVLAAAFAPNPNAVVHGSRPAPYGFFIPSEHCEKLLDHHSVAIWLDRPLTAEEFSAHHWVPPNRQEELIAFQRELGAAIPAGPDVELPAGVPIWLPPRVRTENSRCVWVCGSRDGWISTQVAESEQIGDVVPEHAHPAADSGSIDVRVYAVPIADMAEFARSVSKSRPNWGHLPRSPDGALSFSQWVGERSKVARIAVSLPLAEVDGVVGFAEEPTIHYLDAYGKATSRYDPQSNTVALMLVSALGGALLAGLLLGYRARRSARSA
ncbi:MAG: hypothetical protein AB7I19_07460 [Planctomycetota bacterium]